MTKLNNFPPVYYISLEESEDRRKHLHEQFKSYGITNLTGIISKRFSECDDKISGEFVHTLTDQSKGSIISHIKCLQKFVYETNNDYAFICEDDLSLETLQYWDFDWSEFLNAISQNWDVIQLGIVRDEFQSHHFQFRKREWNDWSLTAYIIKRDYAKKLLAKYYHLGLEFKVNIEVNGQKLQPIGENVIYSQSDNVYTVPLFVEEVYKFNTTLIQDDGKKDGFEMLNGQGKSHIISYHNVIQWWKDKSQLSPLELYAKDTENPIKNYNLARWYHEQNHTASAISYYLRAADRAENDAISYECLLHMADCFHKQQNRHYTVRSLYKEAISLLPKRPEAYFLLSRYEEWNNNYIDSYSYAKIALSTCDFEITPLSHISEYPGKYGIIFEMAISSYWLGHSKECRKLFLDLKNNYTLGDSYKTLVGNNLMNLGCYTPKSVKYDKSRLNNFKFKFPGIEKIEKSEGQALQDMFIISLLNGKENGTYLEIGAQEPVFQNNTYILEKYFNWKGVSIEIKKDLCDMFKSQRSNKILCEDATQSDYSNILFNNPYEESRTIDYLQIDCEPSKTTFEILLSIPFDEYKFNIITYEHDHYVDMSNSYRRKSRNYLKSLGYVLLVPNVSLDEDSPFEDWWVHPDMIIPDKFLTSNLEINDVREYFYEKF